MFYCFSMHSYLNIELPLLRGTGAATTAVSVEGIEFHRDRIARRVVIRAQ
jgi:hypothetical protein